MPGKTYRGTVTPPRWWEKLLAHHFEVIVGLNSLGWGIMLVFDELYPKYVASTAANYLNPWQTWLMAISFIVASCILLISLLAPLPDMEAEWLLERLGLSVLTLSWATYAVVILVWSKTYSIGLLSALCFTFGCGFQIVVTHIVQKKTVKSVMIGRERERVP